MLTNVKGIGFNDVLIVPKPSGITSRKEVILERTFTFGNGRTITCIPVIASNLESIGTPTTADILSFRKLLTCLHKDITVDRLRNCFDLFGDRVQYWIPTIKLDDYKTIEELSKSELPIKILCLDVANGYMSKFTNFVSNVKSNFPQFVILAGNVADHQGVQNLIYSGADIVKVGIGSGSVCTTRYKTGVGVPQVTAINEAKRIGHGLVCSDGGCTNPGDIGKAFVSGADFVMIGGLLAGTIETGSEFHGEAYLQRTDTPGMYRTSEGKLVTVPVHGTLNETITDILGGLRSTGSYIGERSIENFWKANLIQVNEQTNNLWGPPS